MRFGNSYWCTVAILTALACGESNGVPGPTTSGCGAGQETCDGQCVAAGTCDSASSGGASSTTKSSKATQTGGKSSTAKGGTSQKTEAEGGEQSGEGGQGEGGTSDEPTTGGASKGGTSAGKGGTSATAKGGTSAGKGGTSATAKGGTTATAKGGTSSTWVDDPTKCDDKSTVTSNPELAGDFLRRGITIQDPNRNYMLFTNWWGNYVDQSITLNGLGFTLTKNSAPDGGSKPTGFPSIFIGKYLQNQTKGSNLPKQVSAIKSIPTLLEGTSSSANAVNIAYDVWFTSGSAVLGEKDYDPGASGRLMMVWLFKPGSKSPRGTQNGTANIAGRSWAVWQDSISTAAPCRTYVAQQATASLSQFDLNEFIKHSVSAGFLTNSMYLSVVFAGTEVWSGGVGMGVKNFCAKVY